MVRRRQVEWRLEQTIVDLVKPQPDAKWVVFYSLGDGYGGYNQDHEFFGYRQSIQRPAAARV
jgi:hypothetical protein